MVLESKLNHNYVAETYIPTLEDKILEKAQKYELDPALITAIIKCESGFDATAKNPNSTASGYWQFLKSTWQETLRRMDLPPETSVFDGDMNLEAGAWLLAKDGTRHWLESEWCWSKLI